MGGSLMDKILKANEDREQEVEPVTSTSLIIDRALSATGLSIGVSK